MGGPGRAAGVTQDPLPLAYRPDRPVPPVLRAGLEASPRRCGDHPAPSRDQRGRRRYITTSKEGPHQLRRYYASILLTDGVSIAELASYLGHHDPAFTLRVYGQLQQGRADHARSIIDRRMYRPRKVSGASLRLVKPDERPPLA